MFPPMSSKTSSRQVGSSTPGTSRGRPNSTPAGHAEREVSAVCELTAPARLYAEGTTASATTLVAGSLSGPRNVRALPHAVFFGGQLVFPTTPSPRWVHNYVVFALQRRFYQLGIPFLILPIRVLTPGMTRRTCSPLGLVLSRTPSAPAPNSPAIHHGGNGRLAQALRRKLFDGRPFSLSLVGR